jgi:hypothetical protein
MIRSRLTLPLIGLTALVAAPFAVELAAPGTIPDRQLLWMGGPGKLLLLAAATALAWRNTAAFERGNRARSGWLLLFIGLALFTLGQAGLVINQLTQNKAVFFPSPSDVLFLLSYPAFIASLLTFLKAYAESGFPIGDPAGRRMLAGVTALLGAAIAIVVLRPVLLSGAPAVEKALNAAYTLFDLALLVPTVLLLRITLRFPGGAVWRIWMAILGGFVAICVGDVLFAYFTAMGVARLDYLVDLAYVLGYGSLALGMAYQRELLA